MALNLLEDNRVLPASQTAAFFHGHIADDDNYSGTADTLETIGDRVRVRVTGAVPIIAEVTPAAASELHLADGGPVWAPVKATEVTVYPA